MILSDAERSLGGRLDMPKWKDLLIEIEKIEEKYGTRLRNPASDMGHKMTTEIYLSKVFEQERNAVHQWTSSVLKDYI